MELTTEAHWAQLLMHAQPSGTQSQPKWGPVRQALGEILFPVELNAQRVADRINSGDRPPIRTLLRRLAESVSSPDAGTDPGVLAKHMRQARGKVERPGKRAGNNALIPTRLELHVPSTGFLRHEVQRLLVMFAGVTQPRSVPYALRMVYEDSEDDSE